jgi:hypothetical protein
MLKRERKGKGSYVLFREGVLLSCKTKTIKEKSTEYSSAIEEPRRVSRHRVAHQGPCHIVQDPKKQKPHYKGGEKKERFYVFLGEFSRSFR